MRPAPELVVVGQGYVGLPLAMRAVEAGFDVVGIDVDDARVAALTGGRSFVEDVRGTDLRAALQTGRYRPTDDYANRNAAAGSPATSGSRRPCGSSSSSPSGKGVEHL
jgi:UDP-N-acetyl-D-mannosaminuronate dehydrogenase